MASAAAVLLAAWIVIVFARQVGEASTAASRADEIAAGNVALAGGGRRARARARADRRGQRFIDQQARAYGLGGAAGDPVQRWTPDAPAAAGRMRRVRRRSGSGAASTTATPLEPG